MSSPTPTPAQADAAPEAVPKKTVCRLCGKTVFEIRGYLHRVNEKGVEGIWECRPSCTAQLTQDEALFAALEGKDQP